MCIRHISHWQPCRHQRCTGIEICSYAEAHPGLDPSDCPKGENVFREEADGGECRICRGREHERREGERERRDVERRGHSMERERERRGDGWERYDSRRGSLDGCGHSMERRDEREESVDTVRSGSAEGGGRGDSHEGLKGDDGQGKEDKKKDDESGSWDSTISLVLQGLAHAAS